MSYWTICRMKTTKKIYVKVSIIFLLGGILLFSSCEKEENQKIEANRKTLFMYLPWSSNLTNYFYNNISDLEKCITKIGLNNEKVIVFISTPKSFMAENTVFLLLTALIRNFYRHLISDANMKSFGLKRTSRIKTFVFKYVSVPAKWIKTARQHILNIYTSNGIHDGLQI